MTARFMPHSDRLDSRQSSHGASESERILPKTKIVKIFKNGQKTSFANLVVNESNKNSISVNIL